MKEMKEPNRRLDAVGDLEDDIENISQCLDGAFLRIDGAWETKQRKVDLAHMELLIAVEGTINLSFVEKACRLKGMRQSERTK